MSTAFEQLVVQWVRNAVKATGIPRVTAARAAAFPNVKANKLIRELPEVEWALYVYPASDDGGTPVGRCDSRLSTFARSEGRQTGIGLAQDHYLGLDFSEMEMESAAKASQISIERWRILRKRSAGCWPTAKIVARFDGREELGPRALANRSLLADVAISALHS